KARLKSGLLFSAFTSLLKYRFASSRRALCPEPPIPDPSSRVLSKTASPSQPPRPRPAAVPRTAHIPAAAQKSSASHPATSTVSASHSAALPDCAPLRSLRRTSERLHRPYQMGTDRVPSASSYF